MRLSYCVEMLWPDVACEKAMQLAHGAGAKAIEFWGWWNKDLDAIISVSDELSLPIVAICTPFYSLVDEKERGAWLHGLEGSIQAAQKLHCPHIITQVGSELPGVPRDKQYQSMVDGLREATPLLDKADITLVVEPLNTVHDHKGYYLTSSDEAAMALKEVDHPKIKMLFDIYHQALMGEDVVAKIQEHLPLIAHMHCAGAPGRGPLNTGTLDYDQVFAAIDRLPYQGHVGVELKTDDPLSEVRRLTAKYPPRK